MGGKFGRFNPFHRGAINWLRFARNNFADEKFQVDGFFRVVVGDFLKQFTNGNFHTEFLTDFADKALLKSFARLALAAGKFPQPTEVRLRVALRDEQLARAEDKRGADLNLISSFQMPIANLIYTPPN